MHVQRTEVLSFPGDRWIHQDPIDPLPEMLQDRNRQPLPSLRSPNAITILPFVFLELDGIQHDEDVRLVDFVEIPEPRQELRLVNSHAHAVPSRSASCDPALRNDSEATG